MTDRISDHWLDVLSERIKLRLEDAPWQRTAICVFATVGELEAIVRELIERRKKDGKPLGEPTHG